jgi:AcrR family transcriptional regulator
VGAGLRERKKLATRRALSWAAVRLAVERGFENVLVEDIAAEVGVSARTFNNYFSSKAEAIASRHLDRMRTMAVSLRSRPPGEPLWESIIYAALAPFSGPDLIPEPEWTAGVRLMLSEPALLGESLKAGAITQREVAEVIAERTGTDAERDLYPRLVAAAIGAATQAATEQWLRADPAMPLAPLVREALTQVAAGLPVPSAGSA